MASEVELTRRDIDALVLDLEVSLAILRRRLHREDWVEASESAEAVAFWSRQIYTSIARHRSSLVEGL